MKDYSINHKFSKYFAIKISDTNYYNYDINYKFFEVYVFHIKNFLIVQIIFIYIKSSLIKIKFNI